MNPIQNVIYTYAHNRQKQPRFWTCTMVMSSKCHGFSIRVIMKLVCKVCFLLTQGFTHKHSHLSYRRQDVWLLWHLSGIRWHIRTNLCCGAVWGDSCHPGLFSKRGIPSPRKSFCQVMISWWFCLKSRSATDHAVMRCGNAETTRK